VRDRRFVAEHRGGLLTKDQHRALIRWSCTCVEHVLYLVDAGMQAKLKNLLLVASDWERGNARTGDAMKASVTAHALARQSTQDVEIAVIRAAGHAIATAHMADHSLGGSLYSLKAVARAGQSPGIEKTWQNEQLPHAIRELVISAQVLKEQSFKI
jgi:hypothetical protein